MDAYNEELSSIISELKMFDEESIIILDDDIVLVKDNSIKDEKAYFVFSKNGSLINYTVKMIIIIGDEKGNTIGYLMVPNGLKVENMFWEELPIIIYRKSKVDKENNIIEDSYFICNNINNDILKNSCILKENIKLVEYNAGLILQLNRDSFHVQDLVWLTDVNGNRLNDLKGIGKVMINKYEEVEK